MKAGPNQVRFCQSADGVRLAYASSGSGPAMIEVGTWLNHLQHDWTTPSSASSAPATAPRPSCEREAGLDVTPLGPGHTDPASRFPDRQA